MRVPVVRLSVAAVAAPLDVSSIVPLFVNAPATVIVVLNDAFASTRSVAPVFTANTPFCACVLVTTIRPLTVSAEGIVCPLVLSVPSIVNAPVPAIVGPLSVSTPCEPTTTGPLNVSVRPLAALTVWTPLAAPLMRRPAVVTAVGLTVTV